MNMNRSVLISAAGHAAVVVVGYFGLPLLREPLDLTESAMIVEVVTVADTTNVPTQQQPPKAEPKPVETAAPEPPKPAPPPPTPVAVAAPLPPEPKPEPLPEPKAKPTPPPEPKPQPKVETPPPKPLPKPLVDTKPDKKPKEADPFASVLKTVEDLKKSKPADVKPDPKAKPQPDNKPSPFEDQIAKALSKSPQLYDPTRQMTMSEIDSVRNQISECWNVPAGAKDAKDLNVVLEVEVNRDGTVRTADIKDTLRMMSDPFFRAAAESAKRAMFNPKCTPLRLPPERYEHWRSMIITFNPREMFGT